MQVLAKLLHVGVENIGSAADNKQIATVVLLSGNDTVTVKMFDKDVKAGKAANLEKLVGVDCVFDVKVDTYQGKLQYMFGFGEPRRLSVPKPATQAA